MKHSRRFMAAFLALVMVFGMTVFAGQAAEVKAAAGKAYVIPFTFTDTDWDTESWWEINRVANWFWGCENVTLSDKVNLSLKVYISKGIFDKDGCEAQICYEVGLMESDGEWIGAIREHPAISLEYRNGKLEPHIWDSVNESEYDCSPYVKTAEEGDFYVVTVTDLPLGTHLDEDKDRVADFGRAYNINAAIDVQGPNHVPGDGVSAIEYVKVKNGDEVVWEADASKTGSEQIGDYLTTGMKNEDTPKPLKVSAFTTNIISLKKNKAEIKVGKKAAIKAVIIPGTTVTYKSNKPKVASVDKNGKIKGLKKGKAVISATCCGKTVKYSVTVQDAKKKK